MTSQAGPRVLGMEGANDLPVASNYQQIVRTRQLRKMMSTMAPCLGQIVGVERGGDTHSPGAPVIAPSRSWHVFPSQTLKQ